MMMAAAKKMDWLTSAAAIEMVPVLPRKPRGAPDAVQGARTGPDARWLGEMPEDVLDHDHRRIDHEAEVDGADRQQIGRLAAQHHEPDGEGQRERYGHGDDHGAADVAEKRPLQDER
jgi:hypothetical protein